MLRGGRSGEEEEGELDHRSAKHQAHPTPAPPPTSCSCPLPFRQLWRSPTVWKGPSWRTVVGCVAGGQGGDGSPDKRPTRVRSPSTKPCAPPRGLSSSGAPLEQDLAPSRSPQLPSRPIPSVDAVWSQVRGLAGCESEALRGSALPIVTRLFLPIS